MFVFLDIDGVLNRKNEWCVPYTLNKECLDNFASCFQGIDVKIILVSSWRTGFISPGNTKNLPQIKTLEKELEQRGLRIRGITSTSEKDRMCGIQSFLEKHPESYLILDDDLSEYGGKRVPNLYLVNCKSGFTLKDAKKVRQMIGSL